MPVGAALGAAGISGAASLGGAAIQSGAANDASKSAQNAANQQLDFQQNVYKQAQNNLNPYVTQGQTANTALSGLLGLNSNSAEADQAFKNYLGSTNYQFQLGQGLQGLEYANAPAFNSGATGKALNNYAQGQASSAINNYESMLGGQSGQGLQAAGALNGVGTQVGQLGNQASQYGANAQGQAAIATGNAYTNALAGIGKAASTASSYAFPSGNTQTTPYANALGGTNIAANSPSIGALNSTPSIPVWS